jgi:hypothetical protein
MYSRALASILFMVPALLMKAINPPGRTASRLLAKK